MPALSQLVLEKAVEVAGCRRDREKTPGGRLEGRRAAGLGLRETLQGFRRRPQLLRWRWRPPTHAAVLVGGGALVKHLGVAVLHMGQEGRGHTLGNAQGTPGGFEPPRQQGGLAWSLIPALHLAAVHCLWSSALKAA